MYTTASGSDLVNTCRRPRKGICAHGMSFQAIPLLIMDSVDSVGRRFDPYRGAKTGSDYVHAALPSSKLEVMEGQSHIAMITAPYLFARLVISFLAS